MTKKLNFFFLLLLCLFISLSLFANDAKKASTGSGVDWVELLIIIGYIGGVLILLPIVLYTNKNEKKAAEGSNTMAQFTMAQSLSEEERNKRAAEILDAAYNQLTEAVNEDGEKVKSISKGSQARYFKFAFDYIDKHLQPTDESVKEELTLYRGSYKIRTQRIFTGSKWIIISAVGVGLLMIFSAGSITSILPFLILHSLGIVFYILASRTPMYTLEKRMQLLDKFPNFLSSLMTNLLAGDGTKHYVKEGSGPWKRDHEAEGWSVIIRLVILIIIMLFLGFFAAFVGVINFVLNYSTSFLHPWMTEEKWYDKNFS